ncbi:metal-dependent hydrolase [Rhodobacteraceae bacterium 2CG4]|uniref:Metal-dependent hydrolase n=1 Tax=Halovulum marinum TaxID=2662447 RepID=A0A6L5Z117_9RHOB|nr:endonuclease/exonuclease/phosphatase family protein [Halovulum marinum]MSU90198.1 metal-dependent hydrolase [Halovulum marinum]
MKLRVATYNMRKGIGLDRRRRPQRALDVIAALEADVVAVQEADRRLGPRRAALTAEMIAAGSDLAPARVALNEVSIGFHGNALLLRRGLSVGAVERLHLPGLEPRGAVLADIDGPVPFTVIALHLGLRRRDRRAQLAAALAALAARPARPAIWLGDFNEWSPDKGLEALTQGHRVVSPGLSYHAARPLAALDRIATGAGIGVYDAGVCETRLSRIASDHLPVWADLTLPAAGAGAAVPQGGPGPHS